MAKQGNRRKPAFALELSVLKPIVRLNLNKQKCVKLQRRFFEPISQPRGKFAETRILCHRLSQPKEIGLLDVEQSTFFDVG